MKYKGALLFIAVFVSLYVGLNTIYGFYIESYYPKADPFTYLISEHTISILGIFYENIDIMRPEQSKMIPVFIQDQAVLDIFEGCNGLNVMIVYISFILAFKGPLKSSMYFILGGLILIYLANILRLALLIESTQSFPELFYFFHKYLFTASIYVFVFILWYFWVRAVSKSKSLE